ncbi:MAG: 4Fe-4S binding protein [Candidatus Omnitrophica bacterium]|nr:4Fe-4S binding protein [Candidatus Omnitrophota bacterium]
MKGVIIILPERCLACKSCEIQCSLSHSPVDELTLSNLMANPPGIKVKQSKNLAVPIQCCHCEAAPCVTVCPSGAIIKDKKTSAIIVLKQLCIGCGSCEIVCPHGVPQVKSKRGGIIKCDFCFERLEKDQKPACVMGCPTGALRFEVLENFFCEKIEGQKDEEHNP